MYKRSLCTIHSQQKRWWSNEYGEVIGGAKQMSQMDLQGKKISELTPEELEQASQMIAWFLTTFPTIGFTALLIQIHVELDLERLTRTLADEKHGSQQHVDRHPGSDQPSVEGKTRRQVWYCEECRRVGCIGIDAGENDLFYAGLCQLSEDHRQKSPRCRPRQQQIRVVNPSIENREDLARNVPGWALNHIARFLGM